MIVHVHGTENERMACFIKLKSDDLVEVNGNTCHVTM